MREIKFRGWNGKEMLNDILKAVRIPEQLFQGIPIPAYCTFSWSMSSIQEIMQFTGLYDINGVEIYEGDIVECWGHNLEIVWDESDASFFADSKTTLIYESGQEFGGKCVVIGNIYETPELL